MNTTWNLFKEISKQEIEYLFKESLGETYIAAYRLLNGGLFNTTYYVEYGQARERAVLRLGPVNRHLLMGHEENLMSAEVYMCEKCCEQGIACSEILVCDTSKQLIDRDFMIVRYIPSVVMFEAQLTDLQKNDLYHTMGKYIAKIHQITGELFGYVSRIQQGIKFRLWSDALIFEVEDILKRLERYHAFSEVETEVIRKIFEESRTLLDEIHVPHLLHTDLWEGNVLLAEETHEIAAIIDGDRAVWGDVDFEFANDWMKHPALLEGYGRELDDLDENRKKRIKLYQLFYALLELYVGFEKYNDQGAYQWNSERVWECKARNNL